MGQLPPPGRGPLRVAVGRRREHQQAVAGRISAPGGVGTFGRRAGIAVRACFVLIIGGRLGCGWRGTDATDTGVRHPGRGRDLAVAGPGGAAGGDVGDHLGAQREGPLGPRLSARALDIAGVVFVPVAV